jgi:hypothetical protein
VLGSVRVVSCVPFNLKLMSGNAYAWHRCIRCLPLDPSFFLPNLSYFLNGMVWPRCCRANDDVERCMRMY